MKARAPLLVITASLALASIACGGGGPASDAGSQRARRVVVAQRAYSGEQPTLTEDGVYVDANGERDLAFCEAMCGFARRGAERVVHCAETRVDDALAEQLGAKGSTAIVCDLQ